jgi:membrane protein required for colicin V production
MRWVDIAILVIIVGSGAFGLLRGLIVQVGGIVGAVAGLFLAHHYYTTARNFLALFFHADSHLSVAAFLLVLLVVWLLVVLIAQAIRTVVRFTPFGLLDRLGGAVLGLALGVVLVQVLLLLAADSKDASLHASIHASRLAPVLNNTIPGLRSVIPRKLPSV